MHLPPADHRIFYFRAKGRWINRCLSFPSWPDHVVWCSFVNPIQYPPAYRLIGRPRDVGWGAWELSPARLVRSFRIPHPSLNIIQQLALHFRSAQQQSDTQTASEGRLPASAAPLSAKGNKSSFGRDGRKCFLLAASSQQLYCGLLY